MSASLCWDFVCVRACDGAAHYRRLSRAARGGGRSPLSRNTLILIQRATAERGEVREMKDRTKMGGPNGGEQK